MAEYKLLGDSSEGVKHIPTGMYIPNNVRNRHWKAYQKWLEAGNTPEPQFTAEEQAENAKKAEKLAMKNSLSSVDLKSLKLLSVLIDIGIDKGLWTEEEFKKSGSSILDDVKEAKGIADALDTLEKQTKQNDR